MNEVQPANTQKPGETEGENKPASGRQLILMIAGIAAAILLIYAGIQMITIQSQSSILGSVSIMEIYYHAMGWGFIGFGVLAAGFSINTALK